MSGLAAVVTVLSISACAPPREARPDAEPAVPGEARHLSDPAPDADGVLRVLVLHDMEGLSGQDDARMFRFSHPDHYARGRERLTADVNAVIEGLFDGGAGDVHVVDGHGSGNPDPDLLLDRLDRRATLVTRDEPFRQYVDLVEPGVYDAVAVVGMHAKTGSGGFASHTYTLGMDILMNGMSITETELVAYSFGRADVPVIFASGDDRLGSDLETMPWIEYVTTKRATSASTVELRPVGEVEADLRAGARRAIERRAEMRVMTLSTPVTAALRVVPPASLAMLRGVPGIAYHDETVTFTVAGFEDAYDGVIALIGVARLGYASVLDETIRARPDGRAILALNSDRLFDRWLDVESGRWTAPVPESPAPRTHHGAR
jgi:D-amino peptidase